MEWREAIAFYDRESRTIGSALTEAVAAAIAFVREHPEAGRPDRRALRRWQVRRFPYTLFYRDEPQRIYILAVAHHRRKPGYWVHRI